MIIFRRTSVWFRVLWYFMDLFSAICRQRRSVPFTFNLIAWISLAYCRTGFDLKLKVSTIFLRAITSKQKSILAFILWGRRWNWYAIWTGKVKNTSHDNDRAHTIQSPQQWVRCFLKRMYKWFFIVLSNSIFSDVRVYKFTSKNWKIPPSMIGPAHYFTRQHYRTK